MTQEFLNISQFTWNVIFSIIEYILVAIVLAYFGVVYNKKKERITDLKGRVTEWQVETYKDIHRWFMNFKSIIAAANQDEEHYRQIISHTKFKVGYQGMEYASFFDNPMILLNTDRELNQILDRDSDFLDESLKAKLYDLKDWFEELVEIFGAFIMTEGDSQWNLTAEKSEENCNLASKILGIALQKDVNTYFEEIDEMLRERLNKVKISGVYSKSTKLWSSPPKYLSSSQLVTKRIDLMNLFFLVHYEDEIINKPEWLSDIDLFRDKFKGYLNCYNSHIKNEYS